MSNLESITIIANKINKSKGGSNFSLDLIARKLVDQGYEVNVVTLNLSAENNLFTDREYSVHRRSVGKHTLLTTKQIVNIFDDWESKSDVYHVFSPLIAPYAGKYRKSGGTTPVLCRLNQYSMFCSNVAKMDGECHQNCTMIDRIRHSDDSIKNQVLKIPLFGLQSDVFRDWGNHVDKYYAVSPRVQEIYSEYGIDRSRIKVIPNFYNPDFTDSNTSFDSNDQLNVLYVGRLSREKGVETLIRSTNHTTEPIVLNIVGEGDEKERLEKIAQMNKNQSTINFQGFVENNEVRKFYEAADVFVHPAIWPEPFSRTVLEAMQSGCAMIVTNTGGSSWAVGEAGEVVEPRNPKAIATLFDSFGSNESKLKESKQQCVERCGEFHPNNVISMMVKLKNKIVIK